MIQAKAIDVSDYEAFFGPENVQYIREGADSMVRLVGGLLERTEKTADWLLDGELRHDLRNHIAVVKGFSDLILLDLPREHSARPMMENLSGVCAEYVKRLDYHREQTASSPDGGAMTMAR
ncbi:MAG: hypothetical protein AAF191_11585 [Verrucomicrobiota bacterium]